MNDPLTLNAFQAFIRDRYYKTDHARGTPATFMWFIEEVGELSTALAAACADAGDKQQPTGPAPRQQAARANLEEEFADVLAWLCTLANINQIDLAQAVKNKYLTGDGPQGHK